MSEKSKLFVFFRSHQTKNQIVAKIIKFCIEHCNHRSKISRFQHELINFIDFSATAASNRSKFEKTANEKHQHHQSTISECQITVQHTTSIVVSLIQRKHSKFEFFVTFFTNLSLSDQSIINTSINIQSNYQKNFFSNIQSIIRF